MTRLAARLLSLPAWPRVTARGVRRAADAATVALFLAGLAVPLGGFLFRDPVQPRTENRPLAAAPPAPGTLAAAREFPAAFEPYFNDRVGYRDVLLDWQRAVVFDGLGDSTVPDVWVGREGWLYLNVTEKIEGAPADPPLAAWAE